MTLELPKQSESQAFGTSFISATTTHRNNIEVPILDIGSYKKRNTYEGNSEGKRGKDWFDIPSKNYCETVIERFCSSTKKKY